MIILLYACIAGCKPRVISGKELEDKLKSTMKNYLDTTLKPGMQIDVENVVYDADKLYKQYTCTFTVHLHNATTDTTGQMVATIPNDFSKVKRWK